MYLFGFWRLGGYLEVISDPLDSAWSTLSGHLLRAVVSEGVSRRWDLMETGKEDDYSRRVKK